MTKHELTQGHCPECRGIRNAHILAKAGKSGDVAELDATWSETRYILECAGCESHYIKYDWFFSEDICITGVNPITGEEEYFDGITTTYYPAPSHREEPSWLDRQLRRNDNVLFDILNELYTSLNNDLRTLAAIGIRTALDRTSEIVGIDPSKTFAQKLDLLKDSGFISLNEHDALEVLIDAGSAAAHRGWKPALADLDLMMDTLEGLLRRIFVTQPSLQKVKGKVPPKPKKPIKTSTT